jgi:hypothetical protein
LSALKGHVEDTTSRIRGVQRTADDILDFVKSQTPSNSNSKAPKNKDADVEGLLDSLRNQGRGPPAASGSRPVIDVTGRSKTDTDSGSDDSDGVESDSSKNYKNVPRSKRGTDGKGNKRMPIRTNKELKKKAENVEAVKKERRELALKAGNGKGKGKVKYQKFGKGGRVSC